MEGPVLRLYEASIRKDTIESPEAVGRFLQRLGAEAQFGAEVPFPTKRADIDTLAFFANAATFADQTLDGPLLSLDYRALEEPLAKVAFVRHGATLTLHALFEMLEALRAEQPALSLAMLEFAAGFLRTPPHIDANVLYVSQAVQARLADLADVQSAHATQQLLPQYMRRAAAAALPARPPRRGIFSSTEDRRAVLDQQHELGVANLGVALDTAAEALRSDLADSRVYAALNYAQAEAWRESGALLRPANARVLSRKPEKKHISALYTIRTTPADEALAPGILLVAHITRDAPPVYMDFTLRAGLDAAADALRERVVERLVERFEVAGLAPLTAAGTRCTVPGFREAAAAASPPSSPVPVQQRLAAWELPWVAALVAQRHLKRQHLEYIYEAQRALGSAIMGHKPQPPMSDAAYIQHMQLAAPTPADIRATISDLKRTVFGLIALVLFRAIDMRWERDRPNPWQEIVSSPDI